MNKKELFDALDDFSQQLLATLADVEAIKKNLKSVVEENTALRLETINWESAWVRKKKQLQLRPSMLEKTWAESMMTVFMCVATFMANVVNKMQNVCFVMNCCLGSKHADSKKF